MVDGPEAVEMLETARDLPRREEKSEEREVPSESGRRLRLFREVGDRHSAASLADSVDHVVLVYRLRETHHSGELGNVEYQFKFRLAPGGKNWFIFMS